MKRRKFLKVAAPLSMTPFVVNGTEMRPFANLKLAEYLQTCGDIGDRVLVLIQLKGGNDALNMLVPMNQYDKYAQIRPGIHLQDSAVLPLDSTLPLEKQLGLHPAMPEIKALYEEGKVTICQAVGYEQPNQSHFKSTDLWLSGGDGTSANFNLPTGWPARYLTATYPGVDGEPIPMMQDPMGIQVGDSTPSLGFHSASEHPTGINLGGQNPAGFYSLVSSIGGAPMVNIPDSEYGHELQYILGVESSVSKYAQRISEVFAKGTNVATYPTGSSFANQLKTVARLIKGGSRTRIYMTQLGGFDTHAGQVDDTQTAVGTHAVLLANLSSAVKAFVDDLSAMGIGDRVLAVTFSEFGRCAKENGSYGTDHGTLAPMFLFGNPAKPGVLGDCVNLSDLTTDGQTKNQQFDYRQVFTTVLQHFLGAKNEILEATLFGDFAAQKISIIEKTHIVHPDCYVGSLTPPRRTDLPTSISPISMRIFPNPASYEAEVYFESETATQGAISLFDASGHRLQMLQTPFFEGDNYVQLDIRDLRAGQFVVLIESADRRIRATEKLLILK
jgi:uncharacterized protein (DUF1501 family)